MLKIWKIIEKNNPDWDLVILGDGPDRKLFINLKEQLGLHRVTFTGTVNPTNYYRQSSISCITSTHEGFSLAASESLQFGTVPIAFGSYEAINDIIEHGKTGYIIKPFDIKRFSKTILKLINNPMLLKNIQQNIANREDSFKKDLIIHQWEQLIHKLKNR